MEDAVFPDARRADGAPDGIVTRLLRELDHSGRMKVAAAYFRQKAEQCRRLAHAMTEQADPAVVMLHEMADEFDANALALESRMERDTSLEPRVDEGALRVH
ncbi:hypothetical protein [Methylobacterium sp. Leaf118]|uniref:hypothetical protein n=1 Tax=Methylobacterium sp. Leaf118 TaxID=2876562 RepID=UPI001E5F678F|nr:hypothetical protein [Methylobacterium sp. Leaf118]